jgi:hypothetical protein
MSFRISILSGRLAIWELVDFPGELASYDIPPAQYCCHVQYSEDALISIDIIQEQVVDLREMEFGEVSDFECLQWKVMVLGDAVEMPLVVHGGVWNTDDFIGRRFDLIQGKIGSLEYIIARDVDDAGFFFRYIMIGGKIVGLQIKFNDGTPPPEPTQ